TGTPVTCTALDQCHAVGTCNPATGACSNPNKTNGTTCDNPCQTGETCQNGTCTGTPVTCTALDQCHVAGTCNPATGACSNPSKTNGTTCDNPCQTGETCQNGTCSGTPVSCTALDQCHDAGSCDPLTDQCSNPVRLDPAAGPYWSGKTAMATPRYGAGGVAFDGLTYVFAGCYQPPCGNAFTATVEAYDPIQNAWSPRASMPTARATVAAATIGGIVYVVGGASINNVMPWKTTVEAYDPAHDSWSTKASMNAGRAGAALGAIGGKLYVAGGHYFGYPPGGAPPDFVESYDPATDTWTTRGPVPADRMYAAYGVIGSKLYIAGGLAPDRALLDRLDIYDPATDSWTAGRRMPVAQEGQVATVLDGKLYVLGGSTASSGQASVVYDRVYIYDPASDTWSTGPAMTSPRYGGVATVSGETIILAGGYTATAPTAVVDTLAALHGPICSDGQTCTQGEICQAGSCEPPANQPTILNVPVAAVGDLGGTQTAAFGVNASGQVVGAGFVASGQPHAFLKDVNNPIVDLATQLGLPGGSRAGAINDVGTIAGYMTAADGAHAFRYRPNAGVDDLGLIGNGGSFAVAVNAQDQVAGVFTQGGVSHGFRYTNGLVEDIGALAGANTYAFAINDAGIVGGASWVPGTPDTFDERRYGHAVIFQDEIGLVDLNDHIDPMLGWTLRAVKAMAGEFVVGIGERGGQLRAFRLRLPSGAIGAIDAIDDISGGWQGRTLGSGVNAQGDAVGSGFLDQPETAQQAFVYSDQFGFKKLNDISDPAAGWDLAVALAVGGSGDVVGWGYRNNQLSAYRVRLPSGHSATCGSRDICG
ncbi:MAG TPA: kelch repeat-containing protein, partial [Polyangia bacterium]|nr:kelch repeat-containing protein [Polyangia bacterium]